MYSIDACLIILNSEWQSGSFFRKEFPRKEELGLRPQFGRPEAKCC
jgi:hypothetical protein